MADVQIENGYTKIANELLDALCRFRIPGESRQVFDCILRETYGYRRKDSAIALKTIISKTGLLRQNVNRAIKSLIGMNLITVIKNDYNSHRKFRINKNYTTWKKVIKNDYMNQKRLQSESKTITKRIKNDYKSRRAKESIKESIKERAKQVSLTSLFEQIESHFTDQELAEKENFLDYWTEKNLNGKKERWQMEKVFDVRRRYRTWLRNSKNWRPRVSDRDRFTYDEICAWILEMKLIDWEDVHNPGKKPDTWEFKNPEAYQKVKQRNFRTR